MTGSTPSPARARALLELGPNPSRDEIVKAFHRRAQAVHPDVSPAEDAAGRFVELSAAYRVAMAEVEDHSDTEGRPSAAITVVVRHVPATPFVSSPVRTSPLIWVGPPIVVSVSGAVRFG